MSRSWEPANFLLTLSLQKPYILSRFLKTSYNSFLASLKSSFISPTFVHKPQQFYRMGHWLLHIEQAVDHWNSRYLIFILLLTLHRCVQHNAKNGQRLRPSLFVVKPTNVFINCQTINKNFSGERAHADFFLLSPIPICWSRNRDSKWYNMRNRSPKLILKITLCTCILSVILTSDVLSKTIINKAKSSFLLNGETSDSSRRVWRISQTVHGQNKTHDACSNLQMKSKKPSCNSQPNMFPYHCKAV